MQCCAWDSRFWLAQAPVHAVMHGLQGMSAMQAACQMALVHVAAVMMAFFFSHIRTRSS